MQKEVPFTLALESRYPEQIAIAVVRDALGKYNPITLGWIMPVSSQPPLIALSVGQHRWSADALRKAREFVLAYPSDRQADAAKYFGTHSGREVDKFAATRCATERARRVDGLLLTDAVANFECRLVQEWPVGDHILFVGEVVCAHVNANPVKRLFTLIRTEHMGGFQQG